VCIVARLSLVCGVLPSGDGQTGVFVGSAWVDSRSVSGVPVASLALRLCYAHSCRHMCIGVMDLMRVTDTRGWETAKGIV